MRTFTIDKPEVLGLSIFEPHSSKDKWENDVSIIHFPDEDYRMVHHSKVGQVRQNATIYGGYDRFLKFSSFDPSSDMQVHSVSIKTEIGAFKSWWGDGDGGFIEVEESIFEAVGPVSTNFIKDRVKSHNTYMTSWQGSDNEVAFILLVMDIIHMSGLQDWFYNKETWSVEKARLESQNRGR